MAITIGIMALGVAAVIAALVSALFGTKPDPREPPVVSPKIPFIGHLIGMLLEGPLYIKRVGAKCKHPIFTLPVLSGQTYVVQSPALASHIQRSSTTLDFEQMVVEVTPRMVGLDKETRDLVQDKAAKEEGRTRMVRSAHSIIHTPLLARNIEGISAMQLQHLEDFINAIPEGLETELFKLVTREMTAASMHTFYGPENPFAVHPELIDEFWKWEKDMIPYMLSIYPSITARSAHQALEKCIQGFIEYLSKDGAKNAYSLIQNRKALHDEHGVSIPGQARLEMGLAFGINSNASITSFWVLNTIFSRADLLAAVREEIQQNALTAPNTISSTALRTSCPLLNSAYRETMRIVAPMMSARVVLEDTVIADTYLLRKDCVVQIAGGILHADRSIWGPDVGSFNARRFMYSQNGSKSTSADGRIDATSSQVHPSAFRGFGGGVSFCPGRHFAQMEILSLTAVLVAGFELRPPAGRESVRFDPKMNEKKFPLAVCKPLEGLDVRIVRREGMQDVVWRLEV